MYSRSNSVTLSIPANNFHKEHFPYRAMARSTEPEIFTFERIPAQPSAAPLRRKRNQRVMYPAKVRKYLPAPETNPAKKWLLVLILVLIWQIYTEEPCVETTAATEMIPGQEEMTQYQVLPFRSAEEQVRDMTDGATELSTNCEPLPEDHQPRCELQLNASCSDGPDMEAEMSRIAEQSTRNGYVMALLYPAVYHRLGGDS